jgi:hypothetical protein
MLASFPDVEHAKVIYSLEDGQSIVVERHKAKDEEQ